jgi:glycosyltransferase involved in cell wall biosynthesis
VNNLLAEDISSPLVSVVMATYNGERFIEAQIKSILSQTYRNLEIIVVDDGSTDHTYTILETYAAKDKRIKLFRNDANLGYVKNFEKGLSLAGGSYVAPSDHDDIWFPEKIATLVSVIGEATIVYADSVLIDEADNQMGKKLSDIKRLTDFNDCLSFLVGNSAAGHAMLIKTALIKDAIPFAPMIPHDHWLGFVATLYNGIKFIDTPLVYYRQHNSSVFGAVKVNDTNSQVKTVRKKKDKNLAAIRERVTLMYEKCPESMQEEKEVLRRCKKYYQSFSLVNNLNRMCLFFKYNKRIMAYKRRSLIRRWLYCIKMFFTIQ